MALAVAFGGPALGASSLSLDVSLRPAVEADALFLKADEALRSAVLQGSAEDLEVIVTGHPHGGLTGSTFSSRAQAARALDEHAAPYIEVVSQAVAAAGGAVLAVFPAAPAVKVRADVAALELLAGLGSVRSMELDSAGSVWLLPRLPGVPGTANSGGRQLVQAEETWALGYQGEGVKIAVIDTGIDPTHEAFRNADGSSRIAKWTNCITLVPECDSSGTPFDDESHGTHVAATAAGSSVYDDDDWGFFEETGVAPAATLFVAKFLDGTGGGTFGDANKSLKWAFDEGADITSNSWGGSCGASASVIQTVNQYSALGMVSVFAAGNGGAIVGPACADTAVGVGAVDQNKVIAAFSSRGPCSDPTTGTGSRICPDLVAKGVAVRSATPRGGCVFCHPSGYDTWNGTSMATPHVAGAMALSEQMKRVITGSGWDNSNGAGKEVMKMTALDLGAEGPDNTYGSGLPQLLNIHGMLQAADEALIVDSFGISNAVLRQGDSTTLSFSVRNLGGATATGDFLATLEHPDGTVLVVKSSTPSLGLLDAESAQTVFTVSGAVQPGTYTFTGSFDYSWTDGDGNPQTGSVFHEGLFDVKRVFVQMELAGFDEEVLPALPQSVSFVATNTGNEDASDVVIEFTLPDHYKFLPGANFDPSDGRTLYADPAPSSVHEDSTFRRVTLRFVVGSLAEEESWSFTATVAPTQLGTSRLLGVARFTDGAGRSFNQGEVFEQSVSLM